MIFTPSATATQSSDGLTATFVDTSNYGSNDQGYVIGTFQTRQFILTDAFNNPLATLDLGTGLSVNFQLPKDLFVNAQLNLLGSAANYTTTIKVAFSRQNQNLYRSLAQNGCCQNRQVEDALNFADRAFRDAEFAGLTGDGAGFQADMDAILAQLTPFV